LIELGLNSGRPNLVQKAGRVMDQTAQRHAGKRSKAFVYKAYLDLFERRALRQAPTTEDVERSSETFLQSFSEYRAILGRRRWDNIDGRTGAEMIRGCAGEAAVLYLSQQGYLRQQGRLLYPSSLYREDNPGSGLTERYGNNVHDVHTFDVARPERRVLIGVRTSRHPGPNRSEVVGRINLLQAATNLTGELTGVARDQLSLLGIGDILGWLGDAEGEGPGGYRDFCTEFCDGMSIEVQSVILGTQPAGLSAAASGDGEEGIAFL
jgi:hypothetical protein